MSQYKAQLFSILDRVPAKGVNLAARVPSSIMLNILGGAQVSSHDRFVDLAEQAYDDFTDVYVHLYGKDSKPGRKIGHITATGLSSVERLAETISPLIKVMDEIRAERIGSKEPIQTQLAKSKTVPLVAVTMGSDSDLTTVAAGLKILDEFDVPYEVRITSAHRTPHLMMKFAAEMAKSGCKVIIAAAGQYFTFFRIHSSHMPLIFNFLEE